MHFYAKKKDKKWSFTRALGAMMREVHSGDLARVQRCAEASRTTCARSSVLESAVCIGFRDGARLEVLSWMAGRVGTLRVVRSAEPHARSFPASSSRLKKPGRGPYIK